MVCSTIREILVHTQQRYGAEDAIRYKVKKDTVEAKTYNQLKEDSESLFWNGKQRERGGSAGCGASGRGSVRAARPGGCNGAGCGRNPQGCNGNRKGQVSEIKTPDFHAEGSR